MNKTILAALSVVTGLGLQAQSPSILEFDSLASDLNNMGSFTIDNAVTPADNAYVVFGYAREGGIAPSFMSRQDVTAVDFGGLALSQLVETSFDVGEGTVSTIELWGAPLASLAAGNLNFSLTGTLGNDGAAFVSWIVTGVGGVRDQAGVGYIGGDNGGGSGSPGQIGFNGYEDLVRDPNQMSSDNSFSEVLTNDLILGLYLNGNNATGGEINGSTFDTIHIDDVANGGNGTYTFSALSGLATADGQAVGVSVDGAYFRNGLGVIALSAVPEPSAYALIVGALMLGLATARRRRN